MLSGRPSVCPSVCIVRYQTAEDDILKMNELILMQISTSGLRGKSMK